MFKSKIFNIIISGILTILIIAAFMFLVLGLHILAAEYTLLVVLLRILQILAVAFVIVSIWIGIYEKFREKQDIKEYINKNE